MMTDPGAPLTPADLEPQSDAESDGAIYTRTAGGVLWHYTSNESFVSIFGEQCLRATDSRFLSDSAELNYALSMLSESGSRRIQGGCSKQEKELYSLAIELAGKPNLTTYCVFCLSSKRDDLAQWRAYTPATGGVALGVETRRLQMFAAQSKYILRRCIYNPNEQRTMIDAMLDRGSGWLRTERLEQAALNLLEAFYFLAPLLKHPAFGAEDEWRLVGHSACTKVRAGRTTVVPFEAISLRSPDFLRWPIPHVLCGPTPHVDIANVGARAVLESIGANWAWATVQNSTIPFRPWV